MPAERFHRDIYKVVLEMLPVWELLLFLLRSRVRDSSPNSLHITQWAFLCETAMLQAKVFLPDPTSFPASVPMNRPSSDCQAESGCWFWWYFLNGQMENVDLMSLQCLYSSFPDTASNKALAPSPPLAGTAVAFLQQPHPWASSFLWPHPQALNTEPESRLQE